MTQSTNMNSQFDLSKFSPQEPSLCIPFVFSNVSKETVLEVLNEVGFGDIERIDMVKMSKDGKDHQKVFIHFAKWNTTDTANQARQLLLSEKDIKVVYDDPWFWKIWASRSTKPTGNRKRDPSQPRKKAFVSFNKD